MLFQEVSGTFYLHLRHKRDGVMGGEFRAPELPIFPLIRWLQRTITGRTAACPWCAEPVRPEAAICRSCGREL